MLADGFKRGKVDLRDYKDIIVAAVQEFAPGNKVVVTSDYYIVENQLSQSQAVKIGRKICESDLKYHCVKLSKLFNSKEVSDGNNKKQKQNGGHN
jgi:hypothetical protein